MPFEHAELYTLMNVDAAIQDARKFKSEAS